MRERRTNASYLFLLPIYILLLYRMVWRSNRFIARFYAIRVDGAVAVDAWCLFCTLTCRTRHSYAFKLNCYAPLHGQCCERERFCFWFYTFVYVCVCESEYILVFLSDFTIKYNISSSATNTQTNRPIFMSASLLFDCMSVVYKNLFYLCIHTEKSRNKNSFAPIYR